MAESSVLTNALIMREQFEATKLAGLCSIYAVLLEHCDVLVGLYAPRGAKDAQSPHDRDELYIVSSGTGSLRCQGKYFKFNSGDLLLVPAGVEHRFEHCSEDFRAWVIFFGPSRKLENV